MGVGLFVWLADFLRFWYLVFWKNLYIQQKQPMVFENWEKSNPSAKIFKRSIRTSQKQTEFFILELPTVSSWKQQG